MIFFTFTDAMNLKNNMRLLIPKKYTSLQSRYVGFVWMKLTSPNLTMRSVSNINIYL